MVTGKMYHDIKGIRYNKPGTMEPETMKPGTITVSARNQRAKHQEHIQSRKFK